MENRFVPYSELKEYFTKMQLKDDLKGREVMGICSVADILFITEDYKKSRLRMNSPLGSYKSFEDGPYESGQIEVAELDREQLSDALFDSDYNELELWEKAARKDISPKASVDLLVLKETDRTWWSAANVFSEMCECCQLQEE
jgi:hypothetical protein